MLDADDPLARADELMVCDGETRYGEIASEKVKVRRVLVEDMAQDRRVDELVVDSTDTHRDTRRRAAAS